ncbi:sodium:solute symporter [Rickettsiales endosymbiont of Trichoplax sp. H2]|uniref:sodium:solute symporter family protein n=1 Tax=Rickettsiales endosymbiont of Trichoplax sp. H2 TaxID=2021221 RepID=UPI0012B268BD|nr:sodium:solute symporter family protein [Rickettsiales endosymbiont of Trichoplax sp. H2]MSO14412.1 Sodium-coupled monocarboxylate transporter 1 [Rickettsiales endosymbiont of Trichoplax sp. H2]
MLYLFIALVIGIKSKPIINSIKEYSIGSNYTIAALVCTFFATEIGSGNVVGITAKVYSKEILFAVINSVAVAINYLIVAYWLSNKYKQLSGCISISDFISKGYGQNAKIIVSLVGSMMCVGVIAGQIIAIRSVLSCVYPINQEIATLSAGVVFLIYTSLRGVKGVVLTDIFQFLLLIIIIPLIASILVEQVGGFNKIVSISMEQYNNNKLSYKNFIDYSALFIWFMIPGFYPSKMQRIIMARDKNHLKKMMLYSAFLQIPLGIMIIFIGVGAIQLFPNASENSVLIEIIKHLIPIGIKGIVIAGIIAVAMSTADSDLNASSVILGEQIFNSKYLININEKRKLLIIKLVSLFLGLLSIILAFKFNDILKIILFFGSFYSAIITIPTIVLLCEIKLKKYYFYTNAILVILTILITGEINSKDYKYIFISLPMFISISIFFIFIINQKVFKKNGI